MVQSGQITFYTNAFSPHCHRVHIALEEVKADYTLAIINVMQKPEWYSLKVNPTGKIPAITYGGPKHPPEEPSAAATVLTESMVIVEFLAELFPSTNRILPRDPVLRAKARILVSVADRDVVDGFRGFFFAGAPASALFASFEALQARLPPSGFAVGEWSIVDIAVAPYLVRMLMLLEHEIGRYPVGEGRKALETLHGKGFERIMRYVEDVKAWPSFRATWDEAATLAIWRMNPAIERD